MSRIFRSKINRRCTFKNHTRVACNYYEAGNGTLGYNGVFHSCNLILVHSTKATFAIYVELFYCIQHLLLVS